MTKWIKCGDRLPENNSPHPWEKKEVLIITKNKCQKIAWIDSFGIDNKPIWQYSYCCGCFVDGEVTHWTELPEPPKELKDENI